LGTYKIDRGGGKTQQSREKHTSRERDVGVADSIKTKKRGGYGTDRGTTILCTGLQDFKKAEGPWPRPCGYKGGRVVESG